MQPPDPRSEQTVAQVLDRRAARHPDKTWLVTEGARYSFGEMRERSLRLAHGFAGAGLVKGGTVLVMLPDGIGSLNVWLALARFGVLEVPVNRHLKGGMLLHVMTVPMRACW
jgi:acyl-CoA synthetase (AMP-forming)/AMP-acid ligase II